MPTEKAVLKFARDKADYGPITKVPPQAEVSKTPHELDRSYGSLTMVDIT
jgi:hypothetical protein